VFRSIFSRAVKIVVPFQTPSLEKLIDNESKIGGKLFGNTSRGVSRRFFMDDGNSWFYSETAIDPSTRQQLYNYTIRYEILPQGILKSVDGRGHVFITGVELLRLKQAIKLYEQQISKEIYEPLKAKKASA
jgi:hypothetical protein